MSCLFCDIARGKMAADILYEDDDIIAFRDITPQAPHHFLVIPKKHIATLNDTEQSDDALLGKLILTASRLATQAGFDDTGYRLVMNCNRDGGQTVYHIPLHILGGRGMHWPPG